MFHVLLTLAVTGGIFGTIRYFGGEPPESMTKEWQEQSNEIAKVRRPIGLSRGSPWRVGLLVY